MHSQSVCKSWKVFKGTDTNAYKIYVHFYSFSWVSYLEWSLNKNDLTKLWTPSMKQHASGWSMENYLKQWWFKAKMCAKEKLDSLCKKEIIQMQKYYEFEIVEGNKNIVKMVEVYWWNAIK